MPNFPTSLDSLTNPSGANDLDTPAVLHSGQHATLNDIVEALEAKVGVNGSAVATSLDYLLKNAASADPGHTHTIYVPKSLYDANTILTADTDNTPAALTVAADRLVGRKATGGIAALTAAEVLTILGLTTEELQDLVGAMVTGNTESGGTLTYDDTNGKIDLAATGGSGPTVVVAAAATDAATSVGTTGSWVSFSTAWTAAITTTDTCDVIIDVQIVNEIGGANNKSFGVFRGATLVGGTGPVIQTIASTAQTDRLLVIDENLAAGSYTYELKGATVTGRTITVTHSTPTPGATPSGGTSIMTVTAVPV